MGSRVRNLRILEALSAEFELTIVTLVHHRGRLLDPGLPAGLGEWIGVLAPHRRGPLPWVGWHLRARWASATAGLHPETFFQSLPALSDRVAEVVRERKPDLVHVAYWYALRRLGKLQRPPQWVVDTHDVQFERHERLLGRSSPRERREELRQLSRYDRVIAITSRDRDTLLGEMGGNAPPIEVIGMGLDPAEWNPAAVRPVLPERPRVTFYGSFGSASNVEALRHLLRDLWPRLRAAAPQTELLVLGAQLPGELRAEAEAAGAVVAGFQEDIRPWLRDAGLLALSLRSGSGQRGRVIEALAMGTPVVGYAASLEGLDLQRGEGIVPVDTAEEFVHALESLLRDSSAREELSRRGRAAVVERYGIGRTYARFPALYRQLLRGENA
jgi:glycosyltransferase involved in cell wall biosynthesis